MKHLKAGKLVLGIETSWRTWSVGVLFDFSPHPWCPYVEVNIGPVGFFLAWEKYGTV